MNKRIQAPRDGLNDENATPNIAPNLAGQGNAPVPPQLLNQPGQGNAAVPPHNNRATNLNVISLDARGGISMRALVAQRRRQAQQAQGGN